jgi:hypothetical protein
MSVTLVVLSNKLPQANARMDGIVKRRTELVKQRAAQVAQSLARVDTGEMREEIRVVPEGVVGGAAHTIFNEYGTYKMSAQPMLRPAAQVATAFAPQAFAGFAKELL